MTQNIFLADKANGIVDIFDFDSLAQVGQIGGFHSPEGLATDSNANLYVSDTLTQTIKIYAKPYALKPVVLGDPGYYPVGVHVAANGDVYVANICAGSKDSCLGDGDTVMYPAGSSNRVKLSGGPGRAYFIASDARGNIWVDGQMSSANPTAEIGYFSASNGTFVPVDIAFTFPGGIAFDRAGNLLLDDQSGALNGSSILNVYAPGTTTPSTSIVLQTEGDDIVDIALGAAGARLFAPDYTSGAAGIITYPAGTALTSLIPMNLGSLDAVATTPASQNGAFR